MVFGYFLFGHEPSPKTTENERNVPGDSQFRARRFPRILNIVFCCGSLILANLSGIFVGQNPAPLERKSEATGALDLEFQAKHDETPVYDEIAGLLGDVVETRHGARPRRVFFGGCTVFSLEASLFS